MNELMLLKHHYEHINIELENLNQLMEDIDKNGLSHDKIKTLEDFCEFAVRDIKNQLRVEDETLNELKMKYGFRQPKELEQAIREHDVLSGAIDQLVYGLKMQSEPDITEAAKVLIKRFPLHIEMINKIVQEYESKRVLH